MKPFLIILILLLTAILQTTLVPFLAFKGVSPNLVLTLILVLVVFKGFQENWWLVILAGLFLDLFSGLPFGLISLGLLITAYLIDWFNRNVFLGAKFWILAALIGLGSLFYDLILVGLSRLFVIIGLSQVIPCFCGFSWGCLVAWLLAVMIGIVYNLVALIFFYVLKKIFYQKQGARGY